MAWLQQNATLISALASTGMMLIWVVYAWLFYQGFRRQIGSKLFIHEAGGGEPRSVCLLVNLSKEPVHVVCALAARGDSTVRLRDLSGDDKLTAVQRTKQGPLDTGESMNLGAFEDICSELARACEAPGDDRHYLVEIRVAAMHGYRDWPIGASRGFWIDSRTSQVQPASFDTRQLRSRTQARTVRGWIEQSQDPFPGAAARHLL